MEEWNDQQVTLPAQLRLRRSSGTSQLVSSAQCFQVFIMSLFCKAENENENENATHVVHP
jgi:hypothetical protein